MSKTQRVIAMSVLALVTASSAGQTGMWVTYYRTGSGEGRDLSKVVWDEYQLDAGSIRRAGKLIAYHTRLLRGDSKAVEEAGERLADCSTGEHGQPPDERMYSSYPTTLNGDEVTIACGIAFQRGLVEHELRRPLIRFNPT